jgi:Ca2+-binding EF-hand superfamily protein
MIIRLIVISVTGLLISPMVYADNSVRNKEIADRFASCDKNHDGKLTREEAKGCMPRVYEHFSYLDSENKGYVTVTQIQQMASR